MTTATTMLLGWGKCYWRRSLLSASNTTPPHICQPGPHQAGATQLGQGKPPWPQECTNSCPSGKLECMSSPTTVPRLFCVQINASIWHGPRGTYCFASLKGRTLCLGGALMVEAAGWHPLWTPTNFLCPWKDNSDKADTCLRLGMLPSQRYHYDFLPSVNVALSSHSVHWHSPDSGQWYA